MAFGVSTWLALLVAGVAAVAWGVSARWTIFRMAQFGDTVELQSGTALYLWTSPQVRQSMSTRHGMPLALEWECHASDRRPAMQWRPWVWDRSPGGRSLVAVALWLPFSAFGAAAVALWAMERRARPRVGHCSRCGYDLAGSAGDVCPECGDAAGARASPVHSAHGRAPTVRR